MYWLMTLGARTHIPFSSSRPVGPHLLISQATILGKSRSLIPEGECHVISRSRVCWKWLFWVRDEMPIFNIIPRVLKGEI